VVLCGVSRVEGGHITPECGEGGVGSPTNLRGDQGLFVVDIIYIREATNTSFSFFWCSIKNPG